MEHVVLQFKQLFPDPEPTDIELERRTLVSMLEALDSEGGFKAAADLMHHPTTTVTPWISWQLGCICALHLSERRLEAADALGMLSVISARRLADPVRIVANLLDLANVKLARGNAGRARELLEDAMLVPGQDAQRLKPRARLQLGMMLLDSTDRDDDEVIRLIETSLVDLSDQIPDEMRLQTLQRLREAYRNNSDVIGAAYAAAFIDGSDVEGILTQMFSDWLEQSAYEELLAASARIKSTRHPRLNAWLDANLDNFILIHKEANGD